MRMCLRTSDVPCNIDFKPRRSRSEPLAAASPDDARERILAAAQRCIDRHGIRKTTWSLVGARHLILRIGAFDARPEMIAERLLPALRSLAPSE
jgi:hypothetical protein